MGCNPSSLARFKGTAFFKPNLVLCFVAGLLSFKAYAFMCILSTITSPYLEVSTVHALSSGAASLSPPRA
jgi:hypothetical protein